MTNYPPPPTGPQPGYPTPGYGPPAPAPKKLTQKWWFWVIIAVVVLAIVGSLLPKDKNSDSDPSSPPAAASQPSVDATPAAAPNVTTANETTPEPPPAPVAKTRLKLKGNGIKTTKSFTVESDEWDIRYSFNCANFGQSGNFQIYVYDGDGGLAAVAANALADNGKDVTTQHGTGRFYLQVNSTCDWSLKVVG